jgi:hypothetical protein
VRDLSIHLVPLFTVHWIGDALHGKALHRMVREGITDALALDADFAGAGYRVMPAGR